MYEEQQSSPLIRIGSAPRNAGPRDQEETTVFIDCTNPRCRRGRIKEYGFDGWDDRGPCPDCQGAGEVELSREEEAIMRAFLADCAASLDAADTVADVERFVRQPAVDVDHPGMTPTFFDQAVKRAMDAGLCIQRTARASIVAVSSATDADVSYLVSRTSCGCKGHQYHGRCMHRALAIAWLDVFSKVTPVAASQPLTAA